MLSSGK